MSYKKTENYCPIPFHLARNIQSEKHFFDHSVPSIGDIESVDDFVKVPEDWQKVETTEPTVPE